MITVKVDNSESLIEGLTIPQHTELKNLLSYTLDPTAHYFAGGYGPRKVSLLTKKGNFPTGLLYLVIGYLNEKKVPYAQVELRRVPPPQRGLFTLKLNFQPYFEQMEAAERCKETGRGIIVAPTGTGKSLICALIINNLQVNTLVVVPSLELKRQLSTALKTLFGEHVLGKGKPIWVINVDSLDPNEVYSDYQCVIIDEFHHSGAKTYQKLNKKSFAKTYYKFGLTATPFRSQDNERLLLESVLSQVIYRIDYATAVANRYIVPMEAYYVEIPRTEVLGNRWASVYSELVVNNQARNEIIANLLLKLKESGSSTLCLVKEIAHGNTLSSLSKVMFANGQDEDSQDMIKFFNQNKIKALIGTSGILGEGVDTKPCEYVIIAGLGKSKNAFMQQVGRGFRNYEGKETCKIILILDRSHKWTKEHFKAQVKYLQEEYGVSPVELKILAEV